MDDSTVIAFLKKISGHRLEQVVTRMENLAEVGVEALTKGADDASTGKRRK